MSDALFVDESGNINLEELSDAVLGVLEELDPLDLDTEYPCPHFGNHYFGEVIAVIRGTYEPR